MRDTSNPFSMMMKNDENKDGHAIISAALSSIEPGNFNPSQTEVILTNDTIKPTTDENTPTNT